MKVSGVGTAALVHTDVDGKIFTEYYKDSYLVESFDQPLLSVGTLMSRGFKIDFVDMAKQSGIGAFCDPTNCCPLAIHPNLVGYRKMAEVWHNALRASFGQRAAQ